MRMWRVLLCGLVGMVFQQTSSALTVSDSFNSAPAGSSIAGRLTDAGGGTWMVQGGTAAVVGSDGDVSSGGLSASQASIALKSPNVWQFMNISARVLVASGDDYVGLAILPTNNCSDNWGNLGLPSLRLHPNGNWDMYGLSGGTINGFTPDVYHTVQLQYHKINRKFTFFLDGQLVQDQWIWQEWGNWPSAIGFRINSTAGGSRIDDFAFNYTSDIVSFPVVSQSKFSVAKESNSVTFTVSSGGQGTLSWTAASNASWLTVNPASGTDIGNVTATCEANTTPFYRDGIITITGNGQTAKVKIRQAAADVSASLFVDDFNAFDTSRWNNYTTQEAIDAGFFSSTPASRNAYITAGGQLALPINAGDVYGGTETFSNVVVTPAPANWQAVTIKIKGSTAFDDPYGWNQFNILLWNDEDNHVKIGFQSNDANNSGTLAGHITAVYGIETGANRWFINEVVDDTINNASDMTLRVQKNIDGTYKYSIGIGDGEVAAVSGSANISFASSSGAVQIPKYIGLYACAGRDNDTKTWGAYDPTSNRSVDVLVDKCIFSGSGDANYDGMVDVGDLGILAANYGGTGKTWAQGDFNGDGLVDVGDLGILAANYGQGAVNSSAANFSADYAKVFGTAATEGDSSDATSSSICSGLGLPLIAGLALMGLMFVKLEE